MSVADNGAFFFTLACIYICTQGKCHLLQAAYYKVKLIIPHKIVSILLNNKQHNLPQLMVPMGSMGCVRMSCVVLSTSTACTMS
jgi:hypothetical protein